MIMKEKLESKHKKCLTCKYKQLGGLVFPLGCTRKSKDGKAVDVDANIVDKGCKFYEKGE